MSRFLYRVGEEKQNKNTYTYTYTLTYHPFFGETVVCFTRMYMYTCRKVVNKREKSEIFNKQMLFAQE